MSFDHCHYVPCLRWNQGEYQAILNLKPETKQFITPLIEVSEIKWDFEEKKFNKTIDQHLDKFAKRIKEKWGKKKCFVDLNLINPPTRMADGRHPVNFVFSDLRMKDVHGIPVVGIGRDQPYRRSTKEVLAQDVFGLCFRIGIEQTAKSDFEGQIDSLLTFYSLRAKDVDFILDLKAPNFVPVEGFSKVIQNIFNKIPHIRSWRSFTIIGTSFPQSMSEVTKGIEYIPRYEWLLYKALIASLLETGGRLPTFGDYTITHPNLLEMDLRKIKPSANIRYTIDEEWCIVKGASVRVPGGYDQFHSLCNTLIKLPCFVGKDFSDGDKSIVDCAQRKVGHGNLPKWKRVCTNHHIEKVVYDISNFFVS